MTRDPNTTFIVCNIDSMPVGEYDSLDMARRACHDLAREAAAQGDTTNGYYVHDDADFEGYYARDFPANID